MWWLAGPPQAAAPLVLPPSLRGYPSTEPARAPLSRGAGGAALGPPVSLRSADRFGLPALGGHATYVCLPVAAALAWQGARRSVAGQRRRGTVRQARVVAVSRAATSTLRALEAASQPSEEELQEIFKGACGSEAAVTFDQALRIEAIDAILEEGATSLRELTLIWGDEADTLEYDDFADWYCEVLELYDEFLRKEAVLPPPELLEEALEADQAQQDLNEMGDMDDTDMIEDAPTNVEVSQLTPVRQDDGTKELKPASAQASGRQNVEITRLFREGCDASNRLTLEALQGISEIEELLEDGELTEDELAELWKKLPKRGDTIDILGFRDFLKKLDEMFEYVDDEDDEMLQEKPTMQNREAAIVKKELMDKVFDLLDAEDAPCGIGGSDESDRQVMELCREMEASWREQNEDLEKFNVEKLVGDWEILYSTSQKIRRWRGIHNAGVEEIGKKPIPKGVLQAIALNFSITEDGLTAEYDMEELYETADDEIELGLRSAGTWSVSLVPNVVTGDEDLVLKMNCQGVEFDTPDGIIEKAEGETATSGQMVRTFTYMFLAYQDENLRLMRTDLTGDRWFIFRRLEDEED